MHTPFISDLVRAVLTSVQSTFEHAHHLGRPQAWESQCDPTPIEVLWGFLATQSASKASCISCLLHDLSGVSVQTLLLDICIPWHKISEVCKKHTYKSSAASCYLRVCIFLCCQVANLRYAEFNMRFRWLVRCWLNGENSRKTRSWWNMNRQV